MKLLVLIGLTTLLAGCTKYVNEPAVDTFPVEAPQAQDTLPVINTPATSPALPAPTFGTQTKSAHFVASNPAHEDILFIAPTEIVFTFNFDIDPSSTVSVKSDGVEYATGAPEVGEDRLTLTQSLQPLPPGDYVVTYSACWPDKTCHPGQFEFAVRTN